MKKLLLLAIGLLCSNAFGQVDIYTLKPSDTTLTKYYKDGQIRSFVLKSQYLMHDYSMRMDVYLDSVCNPKKQRQPIVKNVAENNNWRTSIYHYKDSVALLYEDRFKLKMYEGKQVFQLILHKHDNLGLYIDYNEDLSVNRLLIHKVRDGKYENDKYYTDLNFNRISLDKKHEFRLPDDNLLRVEFYKNFYIKRLMYFYDSKGDGKVFAMNFYEENRPKEYGNIDLKKGRVGKWYTYYKNGKLESEGAYSGSTLKYDVESDLKKDGKWIYYTLRGCIDYEEFWNYGTLVSTTRK